MKSEDRLTQERPERPLHTVLCGTAGHNLRMILRVPRSSRVYPDRLTGEPGVQRKAK